MQLMVELNLTHKRKSFNDNGVQFAWDSTSISLAQTCPRKYQYRMIEGWRKSDESVHLRFGKHFATALEHYYKHVALGMEWEDALDEVVLEALLDTWDKTDENPDGAPWQSFDSIKTRETLIRSIVWYVDQFHDEPIKVMTLADGRPAVEYSFALPVDDGIILTGHIDRVVEYADNPYVMDQKTTKQTISPYWFNQFKPYTQFSMYTFAGKMIFGIPVKGVIIDGGQINVGFTRFERSVSMRTEGELTEWYDDAMRWIEQTQRMTVENHFPMNPASCGNYGGCEFRGVCSRDPALRENFLKADFNKNEPWDPLEAR
jgi:hypothetical protein